MSLFGFGNRPIFPANHNGSPAQQQDSPITFATALDLANETSARQAGDLPKSGATGARPSSVTAGYMYFDTTLGKPVWWTGAAWHDATGASA